MSRFPVLSSLAALTMVAGAIVTGAGPAAAGATPTITTTLLPDAVSNTAYSTQLRAAGGTQPYTWSTEGAPPAGLALSTTGRLSGTPTTPGTYSVRFVLVDSTSPARTTSRVLSLQIAPMQLTTTTLPVAGFRMPYRAALDVRGGQGPYHWSAQGTPAGLTLDETGVLSGSPTTARTTNVRALVTDSSTPAGQLAVTVPLTVSAVGITTLEIPDAVVGVPFSSTLRARGGTAPYSWLLTVGTLPDGLSMSSDGVISGTPTRGGTGKVMVTVTDASANPAPVSSPLNVRVVPIVVDGLGTRKMVAGTRYNGQVQIRGGTAPYRCRLVAGAFPSGLTLSSTCAVTGTPAAVGVTTVTIAASDAATVPSRATSSLSLTVSAPRDTTPPGPVVAFTAQTGSDSATLNWSNPSDADFTGVLVRRADGTTTPPSGPTDGVAVGDVTGTSFVDGGRTPGSYYAYALFAHDANGNYAPAATFAVLTRVNGSTLGAGQTMIPGEQLVSDSGQYTLAVMDDGDVALRGNGITLWHSGTNGTGSNNRLAIQGDGNLVLYRGFDALWSSSTSGNNATLTVQNDGNLVVYAETGATWNRGADSAYLLGTDAGLNGGQYLHSPDGRYQVIMQTDGNLVVYDNGSAVWSSGTAGVNGASLRMQGDGNLVIYGSSGAAWSTSTNGTVNPSLQMQNDGNLVIYGNAGAAWSSRGGRAGGGGDGGRGVIGDDYPANLKNAAQDALIDPWRFYNRECTSFVAWRLNSANGVGFTNYYGGPQWGNADHWAAAARSVGIAVDSTPRAGAVAWSASGHVAWVAKVYGDGTIDIEDYNHSYNGTYGSRHLAASAFSGYIHIRDL